MCRSECERISCARCRSIFASAGTSFQLTVMSLCTISHSLLSLGLTDEDVEPASFESLSSDVVLHILGNVR